VSTFSKIPLEKRILIPRSNGGYNGAGEREKKKAAKRNKIPRFMEQVRKLINPEKSAMFNEISGPPYWGVGNKKTRE